MVLQELDKTVQTMKDPLAVIKPVHRENHCFISQFFFQQLRFFLYFRQRGCTVIMCIIDPHRESIHMYDPVFQVDLIEITVEVKHTIDGTDKVTHVIMRMKTDKTRTQQTLKHLFSFGKYPEELV